MKAVVMWERGEPLAVEDIEIDNPGPGEVLVKTAASGICHSDLHVVDGGLPVPPPCVLGHEPAGVVECFAPHGQCGGAEVTALTRRELIRSEE